ncbi:MAG: ribonuclease HII [Clostridiales bacterium]|nr:ribonuclease HII [Clostridiales bacterium]
MPRESAQDKLVRMTQYEKEALSELGRGARIAGMDEVGRGPLAGPVVTACVCLPLDDLIEGIDDSKKLTQAKREKLYPLILEKALYAKTAWVWPREIDMINILNATKRAMEQAAEGFDGDMIFIDAVDGIRLPCPHKSIIHGDALSYMIAAASIIAKVERDRYMERMDQLYPGYGFARNKGYGTKEHTDAIKKQGPCEIHRLSFIGHFTGNCEG